MNLRVKGWQKIERRGEENRARRWKAKRPNSRASQHPFHQSDSRLNLPLNRGVCVCIELHKSPYACAPFGCVCLEGGGVLLLKRVTSLTADVTGDRSPQARGRMTVRCQKPEQCPVHPLNTLYITQQQQKRLPGDLTMIHRVAHAHIRPCATVCVCVCVDGAGGGTAEGLLATCAELTRVHRIICGGRSAASTLNIDQSSLASLAEQMHTHKKPLEEAS